MVTRFTNVNWFLLIWCKDSLNFIHISGKFCVWERNMVLLLITDYRMFIALGRSAHSSQHNDSERTVVVGNWKGKNMAVEVRPDENGLSALRRFCSRPVWPHFGSFVRCSCCCLVLLDFDIFYVTFGAVLLWLFIADWMMLADDGCEAGDFTSLLLLVYYNVLFCYCLEST